jgi:hypothetical protein
MTESILVAVVCDNEIFGRGVAVSLREDPTLQVSSSGDQLEREPDVAVVSPSGLLSRAWTCPVLVCTDAPFDITTLDATLAGILPRRQLTQDQLLSAVRAAAAGRDAAECRARPRHQDGRGAAAHRRRSRHP